MVKADLKKHQNRGKIVFFPDGFPVLIKKESDFLHGQIVMGQEGTVLN